MPKHFKNFLTTISLSALSALLAVLPQVVDAFPFTSDGDCPPFAYKGTIYCLKYDAATADRVHARNSFMGLINETHLMNTRVAKLLKDKYQCLKQPMPARTAQQDCLQKLYQAKGTLKAAGAEIIELRSRVQALAIPQTLKDPYLKNLAELEQGFAAGAISTEKTIAVAEQKLKDSLDRWLRKSRDQWRVEAANKAYCGLLKGTLESGRTWLVAAYRSDSQYDTYGVREARAKIAALHANAETGYQLCGFERDATFQSIVSAYTEIQALIQKLSPKANVLKACANPVVQRWQELKKSCVDAKHREELLYTLHNALTGQYREVN